ncbi:MULTISPECIES: BamA/TamA family outer membrane protein [unclassified Sphingobacterium]|uniref:translocation and assembly module lipoprotein TamL n=1 Tax=unclassified Sphingobacterium TaxID=2609468 RepID=UPI0025F2A48F|nr:MULTISPECIES: BamA/TamA family outer membrane protein [unclassified Sphingobacterium]
MIKQTTLFAFASITLLLLIFTSCRSTKYLEDDHALVTNVSVSGVNASLKEQSSLYISSELRPNSRVNLFIYNVFNTKDGRYKKADIKNVGEAPSILDSALVELSGQQIQRFLQTKGYFNAKVQPEVKIAKKRAHIDFKVEPGTPYKIRTKTYTFEDPKVKELYESKLSSSSPVKEGDIYDAGKLLTEREQLFILMKNQGYYDYLRQYMRVGVDSSLRNYQTDLKIAIENPPQLQEHPVYEINKTSLKIRNLNNVAGKRAKNYVDTGFNIHFQDQTGNFRLKPIARYMFVRSGEKYDLSKENLSYDRLYEMNGFRSVKIQYEKVDSNKLNVSYELIPRPIMGNQIEGEYTFGSGMSGFNIANTFSHRNIFGGAEQLEVKLRYGVLFDPRIKGGLANKIFNNDFQIGANLSFPRLMVPFGIFNSIGKYGLPRTTFSSNLQIFNQDNTYSNRYLTNTLNYTWFETANKQHSFTPIVLEYRVGRLNEAFKQQLINEGFLLYVQSNDRQYFGLGSQYAYTLNAPKLLKLENFSYFRGALDLSGNILGLASKLFSFPENDGQRTLFKVPYLQYAKIELDYRLYRHLGGNRQFIFRINPGIAVPYGNNSSLLIFEKNFYSGGMNGIRAWQARTLGPGNYNREGLTEDLRLRLRNLDQLGEIKLEGNAEYRFRILNKLLGAKLNGATFVDFGNIWRLKENEQNPGGEFKFNKFLGQMAIGSGFGLRFDSDYFVIRIDAGVKVKDPQFQGSEQWVIQHLFNQKEFKDAFNATHAPDRYNFVQYNFGIGFPF